jgi:hypothetical protein
MVAKAGCVLHRNAPGEKNLTACNSRGPLSGICVAGSPRAGRSSFVVNQNEERKIMTRIQLWMIGVVCFPVTVAVAQNPQNPPSPQDPAASYSEKRRLLYESSGGLFRADEASVDLFGSYSLSQETIKHLSTERIHDDGRAGAAPAQATSLRNNWAWGSMAIPRTPDTASWIICPAM